MLKPVNVINDYKIYETQYGNFIVKDKFRDVVFYSITLVGALKYCNQNLPHKKIEWAFINPAEEK